MSERLATLTGGGHGDYHVPGNDTLEKGDSMSHPRLWKRTRGPGGHRVRRLAARAAALVPVALLTVTAWGSAAGAGTGPISYSALGDSYAAGPVIPQQLPDPAGCQRSNHNYAHLVAASRSLVLDDVSCSGATTADIEGPQSVSGGTNPPQISGVSPSTGVVTLQTGGNDIGFASIVESCVTLVPVVPRCGAEIGGSNGPLAQRIQATAPKVGAALAAIHHRDPAAKVILVGYPAILPPTGYGCWPQMPFAYADVPYLRATEVRLNQMLASEAAANHATYLDTYTPSLNHNACTPESVRWIEPIFFPESPAALVHPNARGMQGVANLLEATLAKTGD